MSPTRRTALLTLAALALAPDLAAAQALSADDQATVARAVAYLEGLTEETSRFAQVDPRGQTTTGKLWLRRPGKARFEYDPPSGLVVISDGAAVTVADKRLLTFNRYPLGATPLSLFLARHIRLDRGVTVTAVQRTATGFTILARDGHGKTPGQLALSFSDQPLALAGWTVTDAQGHRTQVKLAGLTPSPGLDPALFKPKDPRPKPPPGPYV
jgi:outer membrane lipoprotein-sorting protein